MVNFLNLWGVSQRKILSNPAASCCCAFQSHLLLRSGSNFPASLVWMGLCTGEAKYLILGGFIKLLQISQNWLLYRTRESKQCGFSIYTFDNLKSKSMLRLVRAEKMVMSGLVFARKIARMILIQII